MSKHTPTPWRYCDGGIIDNAPPPGYAGVQVADVLGADWHDDRGPDYETAKANAELIVRAVNSHAALLEMAHMAERLMLCCLRPDGSWTNLPATHKRQLLEAAEAAIDKATEDSNCDCSGEPEYEIQITSNGSRDCEVCRKLAAFDGLLEACKALMGRAFVGDRMPHRDPLFKMAKAAIAKATE